MFWLIEVFAPAACLVAVWYAQGTWMLCPAVITTYCVAQLITDIRNNRKGALHAKMS